MGAPVHERAYRPAILGDQQRHLDDAAILDSDILLIDTTQKSPKMWDQFWAIEMHGLGMIKSLRPSKDGGVRLSRSIPISVMRSPTTAK
jgi:hypothetical protein